jgi:hypothetical protein
LHSSYISHSPKTLPTATWNDLPTSIDVLDKICHRCSII